MPSQEDILSKYGLVPPAEEVPMPPIVNGAPEPNSILDKYGLKAPPILPGEYGGYPSAAKEAIDLLVPGVGDIGEATGVGVGGTIGKVLGGMTRIPGASKVGGMAGAYLGDVAGRYFGEQGQQAITPALNEAKEAIGLPPSEVGPPPEPTWLSSLFMTPMVKKFSTIANNLEKTGAQLLNRADVKLSQLADIPNSLLTSNIIQDKKAREAVPEVIRQFRTAASTGIFDNATTNQEILHNFYTKKKELYGSLYTELKGVDIPAQDIKAELTKGAREVIKKRLTSMAEPQDKMQAGSLQAIFDKELNSFYKDIENVNSLADVQALKVNYYKNKINFDDTNAADRAKNVVNSDIGTAIKSSIETLTDKYFLNKTGGSEKANTIKKLNEQLSSLLAIEDPLLRKQAGQFKEKFQSLGQAAMVGGVATGTAASLSYGNEIGALIGSVPVITWGVKKGLSSIPSKILTSQNMSNLGRVIGGMANLENRFIPSANKDFGPVKFPRDLAQLGMVKDQFLQEVWNITKDATVVDALDGYFRQGGVQTSGRYAATGAKEAYKGIMSILSEDAHAEELQGLLEPSPIDGIPSAVPLGNRIFISDPLDQDKYRAHLLEQEKEDGSPENKLRITKTIKDLNDGRSIENPSPHVTLSDRIAPREETEEEGLSGIKTESITSTLAKGIRRQEYSY